MTEGTERIGRWESGSALTHAAADPYGQGPLPWLRGNGHYRPSAHAVPGQPAGPDTADDVSCQIKGFVPDGAVEPGKPLDFHVTVNPPQEFTIAIYRIGHVGQGGARLLMHSPSLMGTQQMAPLVAGRAVSCHHWWLAWRHQVPTDWRPGAYVAVLTTADNRFRSHVPFTVRDGRSADLLLVLPDVTWQAYNLFPEDGRHGASLYHAWDETGRLLGESEASTTVCFDRPYAGAGLPLHAGHAYDVIRWAESQGYDLAYATARDLHAGRVDPARYRGIIFPGHDEYWSVPMRRAAERARDEGTSLVFLSANTMYWQVTLNPLPAGAPDRLLACRKRQGPGRSLLWREQGDPEQTLLGIQYTGTVPYPQPLVVRNADHWLWQGTGAAEGEEIPDLVAGEADRYHPRTPLPESESRVLLAHSPYTDAAGARRHQETSLYQAPSGAWVFASGTFGWSPALGRPGHMEHRVQRATANLLNRICKRD
ncbi:N,N-dimethylformamidase beta subunit family domain-containing protein [Streptomyces sp. RFCAC02]|uniref:N,N-dimethylformamidase beta subunit family domain-containing protein n=1 Tax=Streptomyces sp. RFCAC02 TaxID=2499143 RepID=UPI001F0D8185|nr:N,N-dimethylformamidase beta subunit family domain-containing protein [Streptomyces sp. RFCAC02]